MPKTGGPVPEQTLTDLEGAARPLAEAWSSGPALFILGHRNCKTTRETLPWVDRIHRRRGAGTTVAAILQDDATTARELVASLRLELPVRIEADPYPLAAALDLAIVPTLFLVEAGGRIEKVSEALQRADLEAFAARLGVAGALFGPEDKVPALKPG
jgi:hypothetical protein